MSALSQRTPKERLWLVGGVLGAVFIAMIGWLFFISPQRSDTGTVNDEAQSVRLQNVALQTRIASLQSQSKNMTDVSKSLAAARLALPATSGVPAFLRTLQSLGSSTGTDVVSLSVGPPLDVSAVAAGTAGTAAGAAAAPGAAATTAPAAPAGTTAAPTGPGVYGLAITAQVNGSPDQLNRFLERLQSVQPRAVLITQLAQGGATGGAASEASSGTSLQLTMQAFVAPASPSEQSQLSAASSGN